jgi:acetyl esterase/lipase
MFEKRIVFSLPAMERIAPRANLIYKTADGGPLQADLYLPPGATSPSPIVIFIHGGMPEGMGIIPKDGGVFVSWAQLMAASQMAGVTFNHRMRWNNGFAPGSIEKAADDLADLIRYLRDNASGLRVDAERICLVAFSSGGPMLAAPMLEQYAGVRCMGALYAYLGDTTLPDAKDAARYSAIGALVARRGAVPPIFVASAGKDMPLINDSNDAFVSRARELGTKVQVVAHPEGAHAFDILNDDETSRAIIRQTVEFIGAHLRARD